MFSYQQSYSAISQDESTTQQDVDIGIDSDRSIQQRLRQKCTSCRVSVFGIGVIWLFMIIACILWLEYRYRHIRKDLRDENKRSTGLEFFDKKHRFIVSSFDVQHSFSDFLPGVAGVLGKPNWAFYVNRGQAIASFGTESKEFPILEFKSANVAYQSTPYLGFRTFIQGQRRGNPFMVEPFSPLSSRFGTDSETQLDGMKKLPERTMFIGQGDLEIVERDDENKIETSVTYFSLPEEDFSSLVRITTVKNLDKHYALNLSILDGLAQIEPAAGRVNGFLKGMGRTLEGWKIVVFVSDKNIPIFKTLTVPGDTASVRIEEAGHYCISFVEKDPLHLLPLIYDTRAVFGNDTSLLKPRILMSKTISEVLSKKQFGNATTPSAFSALTDANIAPSGNITIVSFYGKVNNLSMIPSIVSKITRDSDYVRVKHERAQSIVRGIGERALVNTRSYLFNEHTRQMFLDNTLRGGIPLILGGVEDKQKYLNVDEDSRLKVFHTFSRVHGDLERDYNNFFIEPTYYSQGPGNFRDVVQNRRNDVSFEPRIASFNVRMFLSFIQADGYNPLSIESVVFVIRNETIAEEIASKYVGTDKSVSNEREGLFQLLHSGPFRPGQLLELMRSQNISINTESNIFINDVLAQAEMDQLGQFQTGYWADHWTYLLDLIDNYLSFFPDCEETLLYDEEIPYFFSPASVRPRHLKYVLSYTYDYSGFHIRQLNATDEADESKIAYQQSYISNSTGLMAIDANWQNNVKGERFISPLIGKLFLLCTIKFATRDAMGMGIEYEAGKPGWNDSMNGLVGMIGSGLPETYELKAMLEYILSALRKFKRDITIPTELNYLINSISHALDKLEASNIATWEIPNVINSLPVPPEHFTYWDEVSSAREVYREATKLMFNGDTVQIKCSDATAILQRWIHHVKEGLKRALAVGTTGFQDSGNTGISPTYFSYNITSWIVTGEKTYQGYDLVKATAMSVEPLPIFLEGPTRMLKSTSSKAEAKGIYQKVLKSRLRDTELKMFTISSDLQGQSIDLGRVMAFSPGWLENQSVWMHMSYKFYLELLRKELYEEFFIEMKNGMLPFLNESTYGRPLTECSSFIASSAFTDPSRHGEGFIARLSGSTAEFLSMWVLMMIGPSPFTLAQDTNKIEMSLKPTIPLSMFKNVSKSENEPEFVLNFLLFSSINVTYHNQRGIDLFGSTPNNYKIILTNGTTLVVNSSTISSETAILIRRVVDIDSISAYFS